MKRKRENAGGEEGVGKEIAVGERGKHHRSRRAMILTSTSRCLCPPGPIDRGLLQNRSYRDQSGRSLRVERYGLSEPTCPTEGVELRLHGQK